MAVDQAQRALNAELAKWGFSQIPGEQDDLSNLPTVVSAKLRHQLAQSRLERMLPLQSTNSITADDLEQANSDARVLESDWKNQLLMAKSAAATARLKAAELAIAPTTFERLLDQSPNPDVSRPIHRNGVHHLGTISFRRHSVKTGTDVFRLVLGKTLKLRLSVPELYTSLIQLGQQVEVKTNATSSHTIKGKVTRVSPAVDRTTRSFLVEVEVPNDDSQLKPGSFAKARILIGSNETATTVPVTALYSFAGINKIFAIENGVAKEHK